MTLDFYKLENRRGKYVKLRKRKLLAGFDKPRSGEVFINSENFTRLDLDKYRRERVSMIFQAFHMFSLFTAMENVCYPMKMNGLAPYEARERVLKLLESVGISEDKHRRYLPERGCC